MRIIVAGGRRSDVSLVHRALWLLDAERRITAINHGCSDNCCSAAEAWAQSRDVLIVRYPSNWRLHGKRAASLRNYAMLQDSRADMVLALPGGSHTDELVAWARDGGVDVASLGAGVLWDIGREAAIARMPHRLAGIGVGQLAALAG